MRILRPNRRDLESFLEKNPRLGLARNYRRGEAVFHQGDPADSVFVVRSGRLKRSVVSWDGRESIVGVLDPGAFSGEGCLLGEPLRLATVRAIGEARVLRLAKPVVFRLLATEPRFAELFTRFLLQRSLGLEADVDDLLSNPAELRLARRLLILAHVEGETREFGVIPRISQTELAQMVGTTRSRVGYFLSRFRKQGHVGSQDGLRVNRTLERVLLDR